MEHVNGGDLFAYLGHRGRIPEPELIGYFRQIISGIEFIHSFDICHRDLKLENIVMDGHGRVYIADFGLAIRCNGVVLGDHCGSAHYSPPEVVKGFGTYDGIKADIWSLGCVLYALGSGYLPFDYETDKEVKVYIVTVTYRMPDFSEELKHLIWNILQFEPKDRLTIDEIWRHPAITRYPTKDKHGIECDRFQMPFTRVDLLGPVVDDPQKLNQDSVEALSVMWQRSPRKIRFFLLHDRYAVPSII